ncbi:MAG: ACP S-malonyltransferase [Clostridia bacterium]
MSNISYVFAGQGAAISGMGRDLVSNYPSARRIFELGSDVLGFDIKALCFESDNETLAQTANTQPAIFTMSLASCAVLSEAGVTPCAVAGFSLGEISALTAAGAVSLEDGFKIIAARGDCMQRAAQTSDGAMYAVLGLDAARISEICERVSGYAIPVNFNSPGQTVLAGESAAAAEAAEACVAAGAKRAVKLAVNAGFHSALMNDASVEFAAKIASITFKTPKIPVYSNTTALPIDDFSDMPSYLARQMTHPVRWTDTVMNMRAAGVDTMIEHGPGKVLTGLIKRISTEISTGNCDNIQNIDAILQKI